MFPPLPSWSDSHPLLVHFPIGVLLVAPVLVLIALIWSKQRMAWASAGLTMMIVGTIGVFLATASGDAAEDAATIPAQVKNVLHEHEELAEMARNIFLVLTLAWAGFLIAVRVIKTPIRHAIFTGIAIVFLLAYSGGALVLANAAHEGGRLVHEYGIRSGMAQTASASPATQPAGVKQAADDDD